MKVMDGDRRPRSVQRCEIGSEELVRALRDGDSSAYQQLERAFRPMVDSMARQASLGHHDARDVMQETLLAMYRGIGGLDDAAALPGWVRTIARREVVRAAKRKCKPSVETPIVDEPAPESPVMRAESTRAIRVAMESLCERDRQVLEWTVAADPPVAYSEIARRLGCATGTIGSYRGRALARLRCAYLSTSGSDDRT